MGVLIKSLCLTLTFVFASGYINDLSKWEYKEGDRYILFPDGNEKLHLVDLQQTEPEYRFDAAKSVKFLLYRRNEPMQEIVFEDSEALKSINFDFTKANKIIAHGWNSDATSKVNTLITEASLRNADVNVIVVDWSIGANVFYTTACNNVMKVAIHLAGLIDWLVVEGVPMNSFHLMGHSLGGHLVGMTGRYLLRGRLPYVTAMDPAGPLWGSSTNRINPSDADYVEIIHTDAGSLGLSDPVGHNDFYPNRGKSQPGCFLSISCDHSRAYELMADSIDHVGFMADQCTNYKEMSDGKCAGLSRLHMGASQPKPKLGIFYLKTNSKQPFYQSAIG